MYFNKQFFVAAFGKKQYDHHSIERMINNIITPENFSSFEKLRAQATRMYAKDGQNDEELMRSYIRVSLNISNFMSHLFVRAITNELISFLSKMWSWFNH